MEKWEQIARESLSKEFEAGDVIKVKGLVQLFQNRKQLIVHRLERIDPKTVNFEDYMPKASKDSEDMLLELLVLLQP